jgi:hypothetical protein
MRDLGAARCGASELVLRAWRSVTVKPLASFSLDSTLVEGN